MAGTKNLATNNLIRTLVILFTIKCKNTRFLALRKVLTNKVLKKIRFNFFPHTKQLT